MVSLEDCIAFCGLDENEVAAISSPIQLRISMWQWLCSGQLWSSS